MQTASTTELDTGTLFFRPVHPLNFPYSELLFEQEHPSWRWPELTRVVELYVDLHEHLQAMVCFRPAKQPGHIDNVRCYVAPLGRKPAAGDPRQALTDARSAAEACELQMLSVLSKLHGAPQASQHSDEPAG